MALLYSKISGANEYLCRGMYPISSSSGRYTYDSTSHMAPG